LEGGQGVEGVVVPLQVELLALHGGGGATRVRLVPENGRGVISGFM
jgi:hypothetical protein